MVKTQRIRANGRVFIHPSERTFGLNTELGWLGVADGATQFIVDG